MFASAALLLGSHLLLAKPVSPVPNERELTRMSNRFAKTDISADVAGLSEGDRGAVLKLIEASDVVERIFIDQVWSKNRATLEALRKDATPLGKARLREFMIDKGPWLLLDGKRPFLPGVPPKPLGASFYPEDMTKEEFEAWVAKLPENEQREAKGFFTVIRRGPDRRLSIVPFNEAYRADLTRASFLLKEAATLATNPSLKKFLFLRAGAFLSNDYFASDVAWMDLDSAVEPTIGPYETYSDELFGYKADFEAYVHIRDEAESKRLAFFATVLQEVEDHLPFDPKYRNPKIGALAPIRVVNELYAAAGGNVGVQTAAYNLPNDERIVSQKGTKRVMMKNVQKAKFEKTLVPISDRVLTADARKDLSFDLFFMHILAHELTHGLGPHEITVAGRKTTSRQELKELSSAIEEAKADVTGLFLLQYLMDGRVDAVPHGADAERRLYTTYLASSFRTLRFGASEAHGRGMALQVNRFLEAGAFVVTADGKFTVDVARMKQAVKEIDRDLLTLEATGDYAGAKKLLDEKGVVPSSFQNALNGLGDVPTDIAPDFAAARALRAPAPR